MCFSVLGILVIIIKWRILFVEEEGNTTRRNPSLDLPPTYEVALSMPGGKYKNRGLSGGKDQLVFPGRHRARTCSSPNILMYITAKPGQNGDSVEDIENSESENGDSQPESGGPQSGRRCSLTIDYEQVVGKLQRSLTWGNLLEVQEYSSLNGNGGAKPPSYAFAVQILPDEMFVKDSTAAYPSHVDRSPNDPSPV